MAIATDYLHIEKPASEPARFKRLPRIRVSMLASAYLAHRYSPDEMVRQFPHLTLSEVHMAMAYYFDHKGEIDNEILEELEADARLAARPKSDLLTRLLAVKAASGGI